MTVHPITAPLDGEHVVGVYPKTSGEIAGVWQRRLNLYTGRSLSDLALATEQRGRAARLAMLGQTLSPGVVQGLEVAIERSRVPGAAASQLDLASGLGLAVTGQVVSVPLARAIPFVALEVCAPVTTRLDRPDELPVGTPEGRVPPSASGPLTTRVARRIWASLGEMRTRNAVLPRVGIVVLQPVTVESVGRFDSTDPCERDPSNDAYEDWQLIDACRVLWYAWPDDAIPLPTRAIPESVDRWRNRIAHAIFAAERRLGPDDVMPWEPLGLPIAVLAFNDAWEPLFVDRHSVVRAGGLRKRRRVAQEGTGNAFLWRARVMQLAEQMAAIDATQLAGGADAAARMRDVAARFRYLPPVGVLPKEAVDARAGVLRFFPDGWDVEVAPVPAEQIEAVADACVSLAPFDLLDRDEVRVLVPVPQAWYEPDLLRREVPDPEFQAAINQFTVRRGEWLKRRHLVRDRIDALSVAIDATGRTYPAVDPEAVDDTEQEAQTVDPPEDAFGTKEEDGPNGAKVLRVEAIRQLKAALESGTKLKFNTVGALDALPADVTSDRIAAVTRQIRFDAERKRFVYTGAMSIGERDKLLDLSQDAPYRGVINALYGRSIHDDLSQLEPLGLRAFIAFLEAKVAAANDKIDFGYLRVQTDIYRIRQLMLGTDAATRLATSPTLASIATGDSALATQQTLQQFLAKTKLSSTASPNDLPPEDGGEGGGTVLDASGAPMRPVAAERAEVLAEAAPRAERGIASTAARVARTGDTFVVGGAASGAAAGVTRGVAEAPAAGTILGSGGISRGGVIGGVVTPVQPIRSIGGIGGIGGRIGGTIEGPVGGIGGTIGGAIGGVRRGETAIDPGKQADAVAARRGFDALRSVSDIQKLVEGAAPTASNVPPPLKKDEITQQSSIVGKAYDFRTVTVAERLKLPAAPEAKTATVASKFSIISAIADAGINVDDLEVPGFLSYNPDGTPDMEVIDPQRNIRRQKERRFLFAEIRDNPGISLDILRERHDPDPADGDEGAFFAAGVRAADTSVAVLRIVEGRIQSYRNAIEMCKRTLADLLNTLASADTRLAAIGEELAEARHDVAMAKALLQEEIARVKGINDRRDRVIDEHVDLLVFHRPRLTDPTRDLPTRPLLPSLTEAPAPACLTRAVTVPPDVRAMVNLLRDAPLNWLIFVPPLLDRLDRLDALHRAMEGAKLRAAVQQAQLVSPVAPAAAEAGTALARAVTNVFVARQEVMGRYRAATASIDLAAITSLSWAGIRDHAREVLSIGDLIDAAHGHADVSQRTAAEVENIAHVAGCLYESFGRVMPAIRLDWTERLSQYDASFNLRNLASLPRWGSIPFLERREMQGIVDWLFGRVDPRQPDAVAIINDLVRLCLLVASHAPVNRIIAGHVHRDTPVRPGLRVDLVADLTQIRVGMAVNLFQGARAVARGVVEDLGGGMAAARIVTAVEGDIKLATGARAQFVAPEEPHNVTPTTAKFSMAATLLR